MRNDKFDIKKILKKETSKRSFEENLLFCILSFTIFLFFPGLLYEILHGFIKYELACDIMSRILCIGLITLFYYKDFIKEAKELKKEPGNKLAQSLIWYFICLGVMMVSNLILLIIFKGISTNETEVRTMLFDNPFPMLVMISILAPVMEEMVFRKSLAPLFKNKYLFALTSGLIFGLGHLMVDFVSPGFRLLRLLYVIPYGSLGFGFALMDKNCKSTFPSIIMHCLHNTFTALLILSQGGM